MEIIEDFNWCDYGTRMYDHRKPIRSLKDHKATKYLLFSNGLQTLKTRVAAVTEKDSA
jgi:hypothetical protein